MSIMLAYSSATNELLLHQIVAAQYQAEFISKILANTIEVSFPSDHKRIGVTISENNSTLQTFSSFTPEENFRSIINKNIACGGL